MLETRRVSLDVAHEIPATLVTSDLNRVKRYVHRWMWNGGAFTVSYRPRKPGPDADAPLADDADELAKLVTEAAEHGFTRLDVDELQLTGDAQRPNRALSALANFGAHWGDGVGLTAATRRPPEMPRSITAAAEEWFIFPTHEARDLKYLRDTFGDSYKVNGVPLDEAATHLAPHAFIQVDTRTGTARECRPLQET